MKIQVFGPGCTKCKQTVEVVKKATADLGLVEGEDFEFEKVEKISEIMKFGVMMTPAFAVDGEVKVTGKVVDAKTIANFLQTGRSLQERS